MRSYNQRIKSSQFLIQGRWQESHGYFEKGSQDLRRLHDLSQKPLPLR